MSSPLRVELELDDGSFTARMIHAGETVDQFVQNVGKGVTGVSRMGDEVDSLGERLKTLTFGFWVAKEAIHDLESITTGWIGEIVKINAQVERLTTSMKTLSTAADPLAEASAYIKDLREQAKNAPFALETMHQSFLRLKTSGVDAKATLTGLTDAVAAFGGSDENLSRASLALQEMAGKGVVQMKELRNQLGMSIPNAIPLLARSLGVSYSELMDDIHTGTVDAKSAINALTAEFERSFGGATLQQMKTFNGEISSMKVRLQDIAITQIGGGENGFFASLKKDLGDLNAFLDGPAARGIGEMIGGGLVTGMGAIRGLIDEVIEFKDEVAAAGTALLYGIGARAVWAGVEFGISKVQGLRQELALLSLAGRTAREAVDLNNMGNAIYQMNLVGQNGQRLGLSHFETMNRSAGAALGLFATGVSTVLPWLGLLVPALAAGAEYFGIFTDKSREAFESLERFGAANVDAARKGDAYVVSLQSRIDTLKALKDAPDFDGTAAAFDSHTDAQIAELQKKLVDAKAKQAGFADQGSKNESKDYAAKQMASYTDAQAALQRDYNDNAVKMAQDFDDKIKELNRSFQDKSATEAQNRADKQRLNLKLYDAELAKLNDLVAAQKALDDGGNGQQAINARAAVASYTAEQLRIMQQREASRTDGVIMNPKGLDAEKLQKKGEDLLAKMQAKLKGLVAGIEDDVDPAVVELNEMLSGLKLGDPAIEGVRKMRDEIVATKAETDALNDALKGAKKFDHDLEGVRDNLQEQIFKAKYGNLSELDQLLIKVQEGMYKGVGPNRPALEQMLDNAKQGLADTNLKAGQVGETLATKAFGPQTQTAVKTVADAIGQMADATGRLGANLSSIDMTKVLDQAKLLSSPGFGMSASPFGSMIGLRGATGSAAFERAPVMVQNMAMDASSRTGVSPAMIAAIGELENGFKLTGGTSMLGSNGKPSTAWGFGQLTNGAAADVAKANPGFNKYDPSTAVFGSAEYLRILMDRKNGDVTAALNAYGGRPDYASAIYAKMGGTIGPDYKPGQLPDNMTAEQQADIDGVRKLQATRDQEVAAGKLRDRLSELTDKLATLNVRVDDSKGKNYADTLTAIKTGKLGTSRDPDEPGNKDVLEKAKRVDDLIKQLDDQKKSRTSADDAIKQLAKDKGSLDVSKADIYGRAGDPNALARSAELVRKQQQNTQNLKDIGSSYGLDSSEYKDAQKQAAANEDEFRNQEIAKNIEALREKTAKLRESLMDGDDSRDAAFEREKKRITDELAAFKGSEDEKKRLSKDASDYIAAANQKLAMSGPLATQMKSWGDMTGNMEKGVTSWVSSSTDALSTMITTGKANWQSLSQTMTKDMVSMGLKYGMSSIFGGVTGKGTGGASKVAGAAGGASKLPKFATGGQISGPGTGTSDSMMARLSNGEFIVNAEATRKNLGLLHALNSGRLPAFATGGEIDTSALPSAAGGQNFAPDMIDSAMSSRAPGTTHQWNISTELHAQGGGTVENQDLARRASAEMESGVRRIINDEIRRQQRPGGTLFT